MKTGASATGRIPVIEVPATAIGAMAAAFGLAYYPASRYGPQVRVVTAVLPRLEEGR